MYIAYDNIIIYHFKYFYNNILMLINFTIIVYASFKELPTNRSFKELYLFFPSCIFFLDML